MASAIPITASKGISLNNETCPECKSRDIIRKGNRKTKLQTIPRYKCKSCFKTFSLKNQLSKKYPLKIILNALSLYNQGYTQLDVIDLINKRFKTLVPRTTISSWTNSFKFQLPYHRIREKCLKLYGPYTIIFRKSLKHHQVYQFQYHKAKLDLLTSDSDKLVLLKRYVQSIHTDKFPHHIFRPYDDVANNNHVEDKNHVADNKLENRASQIKLKLLETVNFAKNNLACTLSGLALNLADTNHQRHSVVQKFMLKNDTTTIAVEVPVYLTGDDIIYFQDKNFSINLGAYRTPITGHIDILQIRNGLIHILDYKPNAEKIKPIEQLTIYALALASRTKLAVKDFKCAWFDENNYYEFFPLHAVYQKQKV